MTDSEINEKYETEQFREQNRTINYLEKRYNEAIARIAPILAAWKDTAAIERMVNQILRELRRDFVFSIEKGMQRSWEVSNKKTFAYLDKRLKGADIPDNVKAAWFDPNKKAMEQFIKRKEKGIKLSDRVWRDLESTQKIIMKKVSDGIYIGESAAKVARKLRAELLNPTGEINPGQGVYKSPIKNTMRLARTETNMAYRKADGAAWNNQPHVVGYRIQLSKTRSKTVKARCELCVQMQGDYPKEFEWSGWHPNCLCFKTPISMPRDIFQEYLRMVAQGTDTPQNVLALQKRAGAITSTPPQLGAWLKTNSERISKWKSNPYWMLDNKKFLNT